MRKNLLNILIGVIIGGIFLWLSLINIDLNELREYLGIMSFGWMIPFVFLCFLSFVIRAERWRLLLEPSKQGVRRSVLLNGILLGSLINYAIPRLGEISRSLYVGKSEDMSSSNIFGTVVLERVIDVIAIGLMLVFVLLFVVTDRTTLGALFGPSAVQVVDGLLSPFIIIAFVVAGILSLFLAWKALKFLYRKRAKEVDKGQESKGLFRIIFMFTDGLISIRKLKKWPLFLFHTVLLWVIYIFLTYIPFYAFNLAEDFGLTLQSAFAVMVIATIGVMLPSPGAVGTYHWFVKQSLLVLFAVPAVNGFAYAFISHIAMFACVVLFLPLTWAVSGLRLRN